MSHQAKPKMTENFVKFFFFLIKHLPYVRPKPLHFKSFLIDKTVLFFCNMVKSKLGVAENTIWHHRRATRTPVGWYDGVGWVVVGKVSQKRPSNGTWSTVMREVGEGKAGTEGPLRILHHECGNELSLQWMPVNETGRLPGEICRQDKDSLALKVGQK